MTNLISASASGQTGQLLAANICEFSNKKLSSSCGGATTFKDIVTNLISASASGQTGKSLSPPHFPVQQTNAPTTPGTNHIKSLHMFLFVCLKKSLYCFTLANTLSTLPRPTDQCTNAWYESISRPIL